MQTPIIILSRLSFSEFHTYVNSHNFKIAIMQIRK